MGSVLGDDQEDCRIRKEIVAALRHQAAPPVSAPASRKVHDGGHAACPQ